MFSRYFHGQHANYLPVCVWSRGQAAWTTKRTERELIIPPLQLSFWGLQPIRFHVLFNYLVKSISGSWTKALFSRAPRQWEELILMCDNPSWQNTKLEKHLERTDLGQAARFPTYTCNCWRARRICCPEHFSKRVRLSRVKCFCPKYKTAAELFTSKNHKNKNKKTPFENRALRRHMDALQRVSSCHPALWSFRPASTFLFPHWCSAAYVGHQDGVQYVWLSQNMGAFVVTQPCAVFGPQDPRVRLLEARCCQRPIDEFIILCCFDKTLRYKML